MKDRAIESGLSSCVDLFEPVVLWANVSSEVEVGRGGLRSAMVAASEYIDIVPSLLVPSDLLLLLRRRFDPARRSRAKVPDCVEAGDGIWSCGERVLGVEQLVLILPRPYGD